MHNRYIFSKLIFTLMAVIFVFASLGCPGPKPTDNEANGNAAVSGNQETSEETPAAGQQETPAPNPEEERQFRELVGDREELTQEEVEGLTGFGTFMFPGSQLDTANSIHQSLADGTEIYRLVFGTETDLLAVTDWYRANLESGFEESKIEMPSGAKIFGFTVSAPNNSWRKSITIQGIEGENKCQISAEIIRQGTPQETPAEPDAQTGE
jgi:hypothetical protein